MTKPFFSPYSNAKSVPIKQQPMQTFENIGKVEWVRIQTNVPIYNDVSLNFDNLVL